MNEVSIAQVTEAIYASIRNDNEELDAHIAALKAAMAREGLTTATFETSRLLQPNRQGRKLMQSYFRRKGVTIGFV